MAFDWGGLLGGIGGLAGGIGSIFGGSKGPKTPKIVKKAFEYQKYFDKNKIQWLVADAKKAGIHPLAALGGSFGSSSVQSPSVMPSGQSSWGDHIGNVFDAVGQIAGSFSSDDRDMRGPSQSFSQRRNQHLSESMDRNLDLQFKRESIKEVQSRTALNNMRMRELGAAPVASVMNNPDRVVDPNAGAQFVTPFGSYKIAPTASAQQWEDRYSDPGGWIGAALNAMADWRANNPAPTFKGPQPKGSYRGRFYVP